jgi:hypothetical protein
VAITPRKAKRVIANPRNVNQFHVAARNVSNDSVMPLTFGARTIASQYVVLNSADRRIFPGNLERASAMRRMNFDGKVSSVSGHGNEYLTRNSCSYV